MKKLFLITLIALMVLGCAAEQSGTSAKTSADSEVSAPESDAKAETFSEKFEDFVKKKFSAQFVVEYDMKGGEESYTMKQYVSGKKMRMDMTVEGRQIRTYLLDAVFYSCTNMEGDWQCIKIDSGEDTEKLAADYFEDVENNPDKYDIKYSGSKTVAGVKASCFTTTVTEEGMSADVVQCFSAEGVPLYLKADSDGMVAEMIAKSYSKVVKDSDFKLPAEAQDLSALMQQYQIK